MSIIETKFIVETKKRRYRMPVTMNVEDGRIEFIKSPFAMKDDIKAMQGAKWHGYIEGDKRKIWSVADSYRNRFQIDWLEGGNPYEWFDQDIVKNEYPRFGSKRFGMFDLMSQQRDMADALLTYHYQVWGAEMGTGKTLAAIATMKLSNTKGWWWVGPKSSLYSIRQEFDKWGLERGVVSDMMSYEGMVMRMRNWKPGDDAPIGIVFDEAHRLKTPNANRTKSAQKLADAIRREHDKDGFVCLMTGTPSPKSPGDWWALCEIAWPGFLREGTRDAFEKRVGFYRLEETLGGTWNKRIAWKDNTDRCNTCGQFLFEGHHDLDDAFNYKRKPSKAFKEAFIEHEERCEKEKMIFPTLQGDVVHADEGVVVHKWAESVNEVTAMTERLSGLVTFVHKKDCLDLPEKIYKVIECEPKPSLLRVASAISKTAQSVIVGLTHLRELSDGFQYREVEDGEQDCPACEDGTELQYYHPDDPDKVLYDVEALTGDFAASLQSRVAKCGNCKGSERVKKFKRITREVPCPKEDAVVDLLADNQDQKRIVFFAGFTGSLDRLTRICHREGWDTIRLDGRGWRVEQLTGEKNKDTGPEVKSMKLDNPLDYWVENPDRKIAFVAHPKSGGVALTLCEQDGRPGANVAVFYSNDYDPASRAQAEDRIHRVGMLGGAMIIDLFHLPTDEKVLNVLRSNRKLELTTMGEMEFGEEFDNV